MLSVSSVHLIRCVNSHKCVLGPNQKKTPQDVAAPQGNIVVCYNLWPCEAGPGAPMGLAGSARGASLEICPVDDDILIRTAPAPITSPRRSLRQCVVQLSVASMTYAHHARTMFQRSVS